VRLLRCPPREPQTYLAVPAAHRHPVQRAARLPRRAAARARARARGRGRRAVVRRVLAERRGHGRVALDEREELA